PQVYGQAMGAEKELAEKAAVTAPPPADAPMAAGDSIAMGRSARRAGAGGMMKDKAERLGDLGLDLKQGVAAAAEGGQSGDLFQYPIKSPVSLARQKSAMLPILTQAVEGRKLSIYNESVQPKHPLNGFRLQNTTPLYLMQGPVTVFDHDAYAGDARIDDLAPGQDRLISYALDLKVEVEPQAHDD